MSDHDEFLLEDTVRVPAAIVGISRDGWTSLSPGDAEPHAARDLLKAHSFDVIPIDSSGRVRDYFIARVDGLPERRSIREVDVIPHVTPIRDVIRKFAADQRSFYFLELAGHLVGLISLANLNCRQVKVWLYGLISNVEVHLARGVQELGEERVLKDLRSKSASDTARAALKGYREAKKDGLDSSIVNYLHLSDLLRLAEKPEIRGELGYSRTKSEDLNSLSDLRNMAAHPTSPLVSAKHPVDRLWSRIERAEDLIARIRKRSQMIQAGNRFRAPASGPLA